MVRQLTYRRYPKVRPVVLGVVSGEERTALHRHSLSAQLQLPVRPTSLAPHRGRVSTEIIKPFVFSKV